MIAERFAVENAGRTLVGDWYHDQVGEKIIILIPGYSSHRKRNGPSAILRSMLDEGHACIAFDPSGCGESDGDIGQMTISDWVEDTLAIIAFAKSRGYNEFALIGTSGGSQVALGAAAKEPAITRLALRSAIADYQSIRAMQQGEEGIKQWRETGFREYVNGEGKPLQISYQFFEDAGQYKIASLKDKIACPTLIINGDQDTNVPIDQAYELQEALDAKLVVVKGAEHDLKIDGRLAQSEQALQEWFRAWK